LKYVFQVEKAFVSMMFHQVRRSIKTKVFFQSEEILFNILTDDSCSSICKSLSRSSVLNDAKLVLLIDEPLDGMGTSSNIGRLARLGRPAVAAIPASVPRLFPEALADVKEGFSGCKSRRIKDLSKKKVSIIPDNLILRRHS
jgi:hypothetical protein